MYGALGGPAKVEWVREEYRGNGIDLYALFTVEAERTGSNVTVVSPVFLESVRHQNFCIVVC